MKISARNQLKGTIREVVQGGIASHVRVDAVGAVVTASVVPAALDG